MPLVASQVKPKMKIITENRVIAVLAIKAGAS
jgi:hypothetical protein